MTSGQPAIRVAVNDRQLPLVAVEYGGRILVPFRAVVEALGGNVSQFHLPLPPPARVIAGRTYAPIRFLATQLNADTQYDARARVVQVFTHQTVAQAASPSPITGLQPAPDSRVGSAYPTISANLPVPPEGSVAKLQMSIDNIDVTQDARYAGAFVTYIPRDGLTQGRHTVSITGTASDGKPFQTSWSFETTTAPASDVAAPLYIATPIQLNVSGNQFVGGSPVSVQMTAPPGGEAFAFVCTSAWHFPLYAAPSSQFYSASIPTSAVGAAINCPITAMYIARDGSVTYAPYPVFVQLLPPRSPAPASTPVPMPTKTPLPTPSRVPLPPTVHRTPSPTAAPLQHPRIGTPRIHSTPTPPRDAS